MAKLKPQPEMTWIVYNHLPGGHLMAMRFEEVTRTRRTGQDSTEDVLFTAEEQIKGFERTPQVALCTKTPDGHKVDKNKLLVVPATVVTKRSKNPARDALAWAVAQGAMAIPDPRRKELPRSEVERVANLEGRVAGVEESMNRLTAAFEKVSNVLERLVPAAKGDKSNG